MVDAHWVVYYVPVNSNGLQLLCCYITHPSTLHSCYSLLCDARAGMLQTAFPWKASFFLRFCQKEALEEIIRQESKEDGKFSLILFSWFSYICQSYSNSPSWVSLQLLTAASVPEPSQICQQWLCGTPHPQEV